jgi:hypothetical protein
MIVGFARESNSKTATDISECEKTHSQRSAFSSFSVTGYRVPLSSHSPCVFVFYSGVLADLAAAAPGADSAALGLGSTTAASASAAAADERIAADTGQSAEPSSE